LAGCWSHARRRFVDAEKAYPVATEMTDMMRDLFMIDRESPDFRFLQGEARDAALGEIQDARTDKSAPIVAKIEKWLLQQRALPKSTLGTAIHYLSENMQHFRVFLDDPRVPLTNNQAERCLRSPVMYGSLCCSLRNAWNSKSTSIVGVSRRAPTSAALLQCSAEFRPFKVRGHNLPWCVLDDLSRGQYARFYEPAKQVA
ncbi:MAG: transposase, partial [Myxococcales bacterium]|nr:transposase [Myxococcales bacterium]